VDIRAGFARKGRVKIGMIDKLNAICTQTMRRQILPDDDLIERGLNANRALKIIKTFWVETGVELDVNIFYLHRSVRAICDAIASGQSMDVGKIVTLRKGDRAKPLFLYAGGVSCFLEMQELINALRFEGVIYGIKLTDFGQNLNDPPTVRQEVEASLNAVMQIDPFGPYRLVGYSFGGIFALELARQLKANGCEIAHLAMIDSPQNDHSWPWIEWARLMRRIIFRQIKQRLKSNQKQKHTLAGKTVIDQFKHSPPRRGHQLMFRFRNPHHPDYPTFAPQWAGEYTPRYSCAARQLLQMKGLFRPASFQDHLLFFRSKCGSPIDCDARTVWKNYLPNAEWITVVGNHQSMIVGRNAHAIAAVLDEKLASHHIE
jgi:thioesterase domain-containing protein/aryl carrier-like protein